MVAPACLALVSWLVKLVAESSLKVSSSTISSLDSAAWALKDKYGDTPDQFAADAYDGVHAVAEAVKEAGLGVDVDPTEVAEKLSKAMLKITVDGLTGKLTWNDKGQVQKEPTAYVITDGKYVQA